MAEVHPGVTLVRKIPKSQGKGRFRIAALSELNKQLSEQCRAGDEGGYQNMFVLRMNALSVWA